MRALLLAITLFTTLAAAAHADCMQHYREAGYNIGYNPTTEQKATAFVVVAIVPVPVAGGTFVTFDEYDRTLKYTKANHKLKGDVSELGGSVTMFGAVDHPSEPSYLVGVQQDGSCKALQLVRKQKRN